MHTSHKTSAETGAPLGFAALAPAFILHTLRVLMPTAAPGFAGFSPLGAAALLAGATVPRTAGALLTTLLGLLAGDLALLAIVYQGRHGFPIYSGWYWVYGSLALITLMGRLVAGNRFGWLKAGGLAIAATLTHWLLTNTGVWLAGGRELATGLPYPHDLDGYLRCLANAIPYQLRFLAGTVTFGAVGFAAHRLTLTRFAVRKSAESGH